MPSDKYYVEKRKNLIEVWMGPEDVLALPDLWIEFGEWSICFSTHDLAKSGYHAKMTANARSIPTREHGGDTSQRKSNDGVQRLSDKANKNPSAILSERIEPPHSGIGTTSLRFFKPGISHTRFGAKIRVTGYHYVPETLWNDLWMYEYYKAHCSLNVKLAPRKPTVKTAEAILDQIPFSVLQEANNQRLLADLGDYRSDKIKRKIARASRSKEIVENVIDLDEIRTKRGDGQTREELLELLELKDISA